MDGRSGRTRRWRWVLVASFGVLFVASAVSALAVRETLDAYKVPSEAMAPAVGRGSRVLAQRVNGRDVDRGDIVIFRGPMQSCSLDPVAADLKCTLAGEGTRISRVIAIGGDRIDAVDGRVRVNEQFLQEPYLRPRTRTTGLRAMSVPEGDVFLMGDNRPNARDSRRDGVVSARSIMRRIVYVNVPLDWITLGLTLLFGALFTWLLISTLRRQDLPENPSEIGTSTARASH